MRSIGSLLFIFGGASIIFGFMDRVPRLMTWIYQWGEGTAWAIKVGMVVLGALLYYVAGKPVKEESAAE